jgi:rubrerythrin
MFTAVEVFDLAIQVEANGERYYRFAQSRAIREQLRVLLAWLADQEVQHTDTLLQLKEDLCGAVGDSEAIPGLSGQALRSAMGRHAFSLDELEIHSIRDENELLQIAIGFEEDSIQFYEFIAFFISEPRVLSIIDRIRAEELDHKQLLIRKVSEG